MTSPLSPEAVAQMVTDLRAADKPLIQSGPFIQTRERLRTAADMLTTLAAENATLRAERDAAQSELDDCIASDWPIWAKQIYNTLKEFGYRYDHFDGIDLPEDVSEFLRGFPENAASELMEQRDDALQELATLRASEAAALERVAELEAALANPVAVHANMLRGTIANPTPDQIIHLYGVDALCKALAPMIVREALEPTEYERKVAQMKEDFPNGI